MVRAVAVTVGLATLAIAAPGQVWAQTTVERVLARVDSDIVTSLDVRQARLLKLVHPEADDEPAWVTALVNRRLILVEVARYTPPEPTADATAARRRQWEASLGAGANVPDLLSRAGMNDVGLQAWLRDDLRMQAYLDRRFAAIQVPLRDDMLKYYREHEADYMENGALRPFDDVEGDVRAKLSDRARAASIAAFIADLRKRADLK